MIVLLVWTIPVCLTLAIVGWLLDRQLDRGHEIRWHDRFYQPQLPVRRGRIIDVQTRKRPPGRETEGAYGGHALVPGTQGTRAETSVMLSAAGDADRHREVGG